MTIQRRQHPYEAGGNRFMKEEVTQKIKQLIADRFDRSIDEVTEDASFVDDLGADSLDITELLMALEEEFNIELDDDATSIVTVGQAIDYIAGRLA
jgi:acyl carrier protein